MKSLTQEDLDAFEAAGRERWVLNRPETMEALAKLVALRAQIDKLQAAVFEVAELPAIQVYYKGFSDWMVMATWTTMGEHPDWSEERATLHVKRGMVAHWEKDPAPWVHMMTEGHAALWRRQIAEADYVSSQ